MKKVMGVMVLVCVALMVVSLPAAAGDFSIVVGKDLYHFKMIQHREKDDLHELMETYELKYKRRTIWFVRMGNDVSIHNYCPTSFIIKLAKNNKLREIESIILGGGK